MSASAAGGAPHSPGPELSELETECRLPTEAELQAAAAPDSPLLLMTQTPSQQYKIHYDLQTHLAGESHPSVQWWAVFSSPAHALLALGTFELLPAPADRTPGSRQALSFAAASEPAARLWLDTVPVSLGDPTIFKAVSKSHRDTMFSAWPARAAAASVQGTLTLSTPCVIVEVQPPTQLTPPPLPAGFRLGTLQPEHAELINNIWTYGGTAQTLAYIQRLIAARRTACVVDEATGRPVAWVLQQMYDALGMLFCMDTHRRCGLGRAVLVHLANQVLADGQPAFAYIVEDNAPSLSLFQGLGFQAAGHADWFRFGDA